MSGKPAVAFLILCILSACGSSPKTHYYTLAVAEEPVSRADTVRFPVTVAEVRLPASLDRREMVRQTGANTVDISDQNRWEAPLGDLIRRVLSQDLAVRLPRGRVALPDSALSPDTAQLVLSIAQFGPDANGRVVLDGSWSLLGGDPAKVILHRDVMLRQDRSVDTSEGEAAAMSAVLGRLATQIAAALP
jgi:uncharacterized lipoprotein YmbA